MCRAWRDHGSSKTSMLVGVVTQGLIVRYCLWVDTEKRVRYPGEIGIWRRTLATRRCCLARGRMMVDGVSYHQVYDHLVRITDLQERSPSAWHSGEA